jgi:alpha-mannosidase
MAGPPFHVTIVSHTHWDREWYQPFQVFRFHLVELIDCLLDLLDSDPAYYSFLLDGQTILLEDYLAIRPEREPDLRRHVAHGRLMIGPWYILPDEFLVSPEATVRNLMLGAKVCARFGTRMPVGYTPDPFGHISQLPQILAGCGIEAAALQRGLSDEPTELWWEAPDGTRLLTIYFRTGYGNLAWAPTTPDAFTHAVERQIDQLAPHAHTPFLLLMNGTDHMLPQPELPGLIAAANERLAGQAILLHSTLAHYVAAVRAHIIDSGADIPVIKGELRSSKRSPVLPGVYSARMWAKQRNHACEVALERYAEPVSALVRALGGPDRSEEIWQAWRYLIENHPHDSICGCSIDQVHAEMRTRFDWSQQIADQITEAGLCDLAAQVDQTRLPAPPDTPESDPPDQAVISAQTDQTVLVYNPVPGSQTGQVEITVPWAGPRRRYLLLDERGQSVPYRVLDGEEIIFESRDIAPDEFAALLDQIEAGFYKGRLISDVRLWFDETGVRLEMALPEYHTGRIGNFTALVKSLRDDPRWRAALRGHLTTYLAGNFRLAFMAQAVPGVGYRTYRLAMTHAASPEDAPAALTRANVIENEWFRVEADLQDGTLTVTDQSTGAVYRGLNRVQDGGDRGDEYNYCAPAEDTLITRPAHPPVIERREDDLFGQNLTIQARYAIPADLTSNRTARTSQTVDMPISFTIRLVPGVRRIDVQAELVNPAPNHRLRVLFPTGLQGDSVIVDGHFDRLCRQPVNVDVGEDWAERPASTAAQRAFTAIEENENGLLIAARGLPEYEHFKSSTGSTLALTLIRAVGWLSRDDLDCRPGHAGPARTTPGAQCIGPAAAEYSLIPFGSAFTLDQAAQKSYAFIAPLRSVTAEPLNDTLPAALQFVSLAPDELVLTAVKPAESGAGIIIRFYNSSEHAVSGSLTFDLPVRAITPTNLLEEPHVPSREWVIKDGVIVLNVPAKRIVSLRVHPC